jgi:hypothetical protein
MAFLLLYFSRGFFVYFPPPVHVYIQASGPHMNTSAIHNSLNFQQFFHQLQQQQQPKQVRVS